jgi:phage N-6-adenine-methyltransferase
MGRDVRQMPEQKPGRSKQDYRTPKEFIEAVESRFGRLQFDLAATHRNTAAPQFYSPKDDSLKSPWLEAAIPGTRFWLNPPFGDIEPWAARCNFYRDYAVRKQCYIFFLVPASVGSNWYASHVHGKALVLFLSPRLSFDGKNPYPKDCLLACYGPAPDYETWRWKP